MASNTPRVGFYMPADDGSEPINVATDLNDNLEKLDSAIGFVPATSTVDPSAVFDGMAVYETNTGRAKFRKGGVWNYLLNAGASFLGDIYLALGQKLGIGTTTPTAVVEAVVSNIVTAPTLLKFRQSTDANSRMQIDSDGIKIGPGTGATDVQIYRPSANQVAIVGSVSVGSGLAVTGAVSAGSFTTAGDLHVGGSITSDMTMLGKLAGTGINVPNYVRKINDTARLNQTVVSADPDFQFTAEANMVYVVELFLFYTSSTTVDLKCNWTVPTGATGQRWVLGMAPGQTDRDNTLMRTSIQIHNTEVVYGGFTLGAWVGAKETMTLVMGPNAGLVQFCWAQNTSSGTDAATVKGTSIMRYMKVA